MVTDKWEEVMKNMKKALGLMTAAAILALSATTAFAGAKIVVIGGKADDPFWSIVKRGAEDAGKVVEAQGGSVTWLGHRITTTSVPTQRN